MEKNRLVSRVEVGTKKHLKPGEPDAVMIRFQCVTGPDQQPQWSPWYWMRSRIAQDLQQALTTHSEIRSGQLPDQDGPTH